MRAALLLALLASRVADSFAPARPLRLARHVRSAEPAPSEAAEPEEPLPELAATYACFSDAEDAALALSKRGEKEAAIQLFEIALKLPGEGRDILRQRMAASSPVGGSRPVDGLEEVKFASRIEVQCAKYNIACCHAALGRSAEALDSLTEAFELGFDGYDTALEDSELQVLGPELDALVTRFRPAPFQLPSMPTMPSAGATPSAPSMPSMPKMPDGMPKLPDGLPKLPDGLPSLPKIPELPSLPKFKNPFN